MVLTIASYNNLIPFNMKEDKVTIHVNNQVFHEDKEQFTPDELRQLVNLPANYEVWKIVKSPDAEGALPVDDIQITSSIEVKSGDKFRVVPAGTFGE